VKNPVVRIKIRVRLADGSYPFLDPVVSGNGKLKPSYAIVNGKHEHHPEGVYHLRFATHGKRQWEPVGSDAQFAQIAKLKKEKLLEAEAAGVEIIEEAQPPKKLTLTDAIAEYLVEIKAQRAHKTLLAYQLTLRLFAESCCKRYLDDVERKDIIAFIGFLKEQGNGPRTVANRVAYLKIFLHHFDIRGLLGKKDKPKFTGKIVSAYRPDEVRALMATADQEERELFQFFLCTGCRDKEVQYATWRDVDFAARTFTVTEKLELGFVPKDKEEGTIPIPDSLVELLQERRRRYPTTRLIFPGPNGKANGHYLRILKRLGFRAGLNCGECINKKGQSCATHPTCSRWELHRWRKTFASWHSEARVPVRRIQAWLRPSDLSTTLRYLAGSDDRSQHTRDLVNSTFAGNFTAESRNPTFGS
jgi:integrase/recombinase XerD